MEAEFDVLGLTHQEIGKYLAVKWNLPPTLCDAILNHHSPNLSTENKILTAIVHLADYATNKIESAGNYWDDDYQLSSSVFEILNLGNQQAVDEFVSRYKDMLMQEAGAFRI